MDKEVRKVATISTISATNKLQICHTFVDSVYVDFEFKSVKSADRIELERKDRGRREGGIDGWQDEMTCRGRSFDIGRETMNPLRYTYLYTDVVSVSFRPITSLFLTS